MSNEDIRDFCSNRFTFSYNMLWKPDQPVAIVVAVAAATAPVVGRRIAAFGSSSSVKPRTC